MLSTYLDVGVDLVGRAAMHQGQFKDVVLTDDVVYRFPRTEAGRRQLGTHADILNTVRRLGLAVAVPTPLNVHTDAPVGRCYLAMTRVPGARPAQRVCPARGSSANWQR